MDLKRGDTAGGVVLQKTIFAFGNDTSTGLDDTSDDDAISMVCMCVSCVDVQCNIPQKSYIHLSKNASQDNAIFAQKYILHI